MKLSDAIEYSFKSTKDMTLEARFVVDPQMENFDFTSTYTTSL